MSDAGDEFTEGTCRWCGEAGTVYVDNIFCEDCDIRVVHCSICDEEHHTDYGKCRHVFEDCHGTWRGSGINQRDEEMREAFHAFLAALPVEFSLDLRRAVLSLKFHTWMIAPMIGGGGILRLYGFGDSGWKWGEAIIDLGESATAEGVADGYHWLVSLYDDKTRRASLTTAKWIRQHIKQRSAP